jgi:high frequency lysogenization protein
MNLSPTENKAIALAGMLQAIGLVKEIALSGYLNSQDFKTCVNSLFITEPKYTIEVYDNLANLERGLTLLESLLNERISAQHRDLISYSVNINNLAGKLLRKGKMLDLIAKQLFSAKHQAQHFGSNHDNVIANIADIYSQTISTFSYRIQVKGEYTYLQQKRVADQIRALLLAAIRSNILWRQNGGKLWWLILHRGKLLSATQELLKQSKLQNLEKR